VRLMYRSSPIRVLNDLLRIPCFVMAFRIASIPSGVLGPFDLPPCMRQRPLGICAFLHGRPARVFAPHAWGLASLIVALPSRVTAYLPYRSVQRRPLGLHRSRGCVEPQCAASGLCAGFVGHSRCWRRYRNIGSRRSRAASGPPLADSGSPPFWRVSLARTRARLPFDERAVSQDCYRPDRSGEV